MNDLQHLETQHAFAHFVPQLRCPLCKAALKEPHDNSLLCERGHCFDIAKKGYVNFVPQQRQTKYEKSLFQSRSLVYEAGLYATVAHELLLVAQERFGLDSVLLDAGCGEGYYAQQLNQNGFSNVIALDIEKEAIRIATTKSKKICWMVADLANIPIKDGSVGALVNVCSPSNYSEFSRVLCENGVLLKAVPGEMHLQEIRFHPQANLQPYSSDRVIDHLRQSGFCVEDQRKCRHQYAITSDLLTLLLNMTPLLFDKNRDTSVFFDIDIITVDVDIFICRKSETRLHNA